MAQPETLGRSVSYSITLTCLDCGHVVRWPKKMAVRVFGAHATPYLIREVIKCSVCNSKRCDVSK